MMPELPEVETLRCGLVPHLEGQTVQTVIVRNDQLRWPIPKNLPTLLPGQIIQHIHRRSKYLLFACTQGHLIIHLGMSGRLRLLSPMTAVNKHDHLDIIFKNNLCLRYNDVRRFGSILWTAAPVLEHPLLNNLGPEPLTDDFNGDHLYRLAQRRKITVKAFIMEGHIVAGVGNIYANEALFSARLHPTRPAGNILLSEYQKLAIEIKQVLIAALAQGGTTLKDFRNETGQPGYFKQALKVYGRSGKPCVQCGTRIEQQTLAQRSSYYCPCCQQ
jgi:formamidopyrimidine-DNA glycosylase